MRCTASSPACCSSARSAAPCASPASRSDIINVITGVLLVALGGVGKLPRLAASTSRPRPSARRRDEPGRRPTDPDRQLHRNTSQCTYTDTTCTKEGNNDVRTSAQRTPRARGGDRSPWARARPRRLLRFQRRHGRARAVTAATPTSRSRSCPRTSATRTSTPRPAAPKRPPKSSAARSRRSARPRPAPTSQVSYIQTAAQQGVGGLVVSANDPEAICDALNEARDAGVKVVTFDSDTNPECRDLFINQATAEGIAKIQVDLIAEQIGDAGRSRSCRLRPTRRTRTPGSR